jgi:hypothetical protein
MNSICLDYVVSPRNSSAFANSKCKTISAEVDFRQRWIFGGCCMITPQTRQVLRGFDLS